MYGRRNNNYNSNYNYNNYNSYNGGGSNTKNIPCKYFQMGKCNKGSNCNYSHNTNNYSNNNRNNNYNSFNGTIGSRFNNFSSNNNGDVMEISDAPNGKNEQQILTEYLQQSSLQRLNQEILNDMKSAMSEMQVDPLTSAYSPGYPGKVLIIDQSRELSSQEIRWKHYQAQQSNSISQHEQEMKARRADVGKCLLFVKSNSLKAARYSQLGTDNLSKNMSSASSMKPFIDFEPNFSSNVSSFGTSSTTKSGNIFGTSQQLGQAATSNSAVGNPFGSSPFANAGNTASSGTSAFGTPAFSNSSFSANNNTTSGGFGGATTGAFGAPAFGTNSNSAFGAGNTNNGTSAFGTPSFKTANGTGQNNAANPTSAFGASPFGANASTTQTFGNQSTNTGSVFGNAAFSANTQTANNGTQPSAAPFGSSAFGSNAFGSGAFGNSPFAAASEKSVNAGAMPSGNTANTATVFGQPAFSSNSFNSQGSAQAQPNLTSNAAPQNVNNGFGGQGAANSSQNATSFAGFSFGAAGAQEANGNNSGIQNRRFVQGLPDPSIKNCTKEDLPNTVLEQFSKPSFDLGRVPDCPPPFELVA
ncbi:hypothetical protein ACO0QE_002650 [Hanseniaspora vineae]